MNILPQGKQICATQNSTPLYVTGRPKPVAFVVGVKLRKGIDAKKHLVLKPHPSIAFDSEVLTQAEKLCVQIIEVKDITTNDIWTITFADFRRYQFFVDRGFGLQYATEFGRWQRNGQPSELAQREQLQANKVSQLNMFDTPSYAEVHR